MYWSCFASSIRTVILATSAVLLSCSQAGADPITGGNTTIDFDSFPIAALVGLGITVVPVGPATADLGAAPPNAVFPITGGDTATSITHAGGLAFTRKNAFAEMQNFIIHFAGPDAGKLTGEFSAGGNTFESLPFFDIGAGNVLTLDAAFAADLTSLYKAPDLTGLPIGTAIINASTAASPEPGSMALLGIGTISLIALWRKKSFA